MKKIPKTMISALLISVLCTGTVLAAEFDPSLDVDTSKSGKFIVKINEENNEVLEEEKPTLTIPCDFADAYVTFEGETIPSTLKNDSISFTVSAAGEYSIIALEDDKAEDSDSNNRRPKRKSSSSKKEEVTVQEEPAVEERTEIILTIDSNVALVKGGSVINDVPPIIRNERTMLPIRFVAEALGGTVAWNEAAQTVSITKGDIEMEIYIGQSFALVNGDPVQLDSPAFIENDRTYLPLRFVAENLGAEVIWNGADQTVKIIPDK